MDKYEIHPKDNFLESMKRKHSVNADKEAAALKPNKFKMEDLDYTNIPAKMSIMNPLSKPSAKPAKSGENSLQGGLPKDFKA